jgi:hypothetical protein
VRRNKFNLSHGRPLTMNMGELVPVCALEVLAGDTMQHHTSALIRFMPMNAPIMHPIRAKIHHYFVPWRLVWDDFEDFITGGEDGLDDSTYPTLDLLGASNAGIGTLTDYLGMPTGADITTSALYHRAYSLIWNEYYRDTQLQTALTIDTSSGSDTTTNTSLQYCNWDKDRFTKARPNEQLGSAVSLPLGTIAPVELINETGSVSGQNISKEAGANGRVKMDGGDYDARQLIANLASATAADVNDLRRAFALQRFAEWRNIGGGRYEDYLRQYNIKGLDSRLQKPEYLGGGSQTIQVSEVLQHGVDSSDDGVGTLKGHGIGAMRSNRYRKFFPEHGVIISLMSVMPRNIYMNGIHRQFNRRTKEDFWHRDLEALGNQAIQNKEIRAAHSDPDGTFGYCPRYDEYRSHPGTVHGDFRDTLDHWHAARNITGDPALNSSFITANPTDRIFAQNTHDNVMCMVHNKIISRRLVSQRAKYTGLS